jgi:NAD(P)H-hydrate epimerase
MEYVYSEYLKQLYRPSADSHKGQNGKLLIIGGSSLFHSASIWAAEISSYFNDMVHYSSIEENNQIVQNLKGLFRNGIVVTQKDIPSYVEEDDAVLIGPGMVRASEKPEPIKGKWNEILAIENEGIRTRNMVHFLLQQYPEKRFVVDAGALQMMDVSWLKLLKVPAIVTPHQIEFENAFGIEVQTKTVDEKKEIVKQKAADYNCVIMLKAVVDIVSDGDKCVVIEGGNAGLTKGGTGDVLAGTTASFYTKNDPMVAAISASVLLKTTADELAKERESWYNVANLIDKMPVVLKQLLS